MSKSTNALESAITSFLGADADAKAKQIAAEWKQKVVPAVLVTCNGNEFQIIPTVMRRSGQCWHHTVDDRMNKIYPIKPRR